MSWDRMVPYSRSGHLLHFTNGSADVDWRGVSSWQATMSVDGWSRGGHSIVVTLRDENGRMWPTMLARSWNWCRTLSTAR
jgi:hypothetical protein